MKRLLKQQLYKFSQTPKDYYKVLGLQPGCNQEEIKGAYRELVKQYHPDMHTGSPLPTADHHIRFQQIAEAYSVLSIQTAKMNYDYQQKTQPHMATYSAKQQVMQQHRMSNGQVARAQQQGYEAEKRAFIKRQNKLYNVDDFNRVKGGLPMPRSGNRRGHSRNQPGGFNYPDLHNMEMNQNPDEQHVDTRDKLAYNRYTNEDQVAILRREQRPWFQAKVDYSYFNYDKPKASLRYLRNIFMFFFGSAMLINTYLRRTNRKAIQQLRAYKARGNQIIHHVAGQKVYKTQSGIYRLQ